jgi:hypothetical protein
MNDNPALNRAYELIEADRLDEAQNILKPILDGNPDNADAWWLYAHAVTDPDTARTALSNVKRLEPDYPGAAALLQSLDEKYPTARPTISRIERLEPLHSTAPGMPSTLPGLSTDDEPDFGDLDDDEEEPVQPRPAQPNRRPLLLIGALILIALVVVAILVLNPFRPAAPTDTPTPGGQIAANNPTATADLSTVATTGAQAAPTDFPTLTRVETEQTGGETPTVEPATGVTNSTATLEPPPTLEAGAILPETTADTFSTLLPAFSQFTLPDNSISIQQTELGQTLLVSVCTAAGASLRTTLPQVMDVAARQIGQSTGQIDAIGTRLVDCQNNNALLRTIAVSSADAQAYTSGSLTEEAFQAKWKAVR